MGVVTLPPTPQKTKAMESTASPLAYGSTPATRKPPTVATCGFMGPRARKALRPIPAGRNTLQCVGLPTYRPAFGHAGKYGIAFESSDNRSGELWQPLEEARKTPSGWSFSLKVVCSRPPGPARLDKI